MAQVLPGAGDTGEGPPVWGEGLGHQLCAAWEPPQPHRLSGLGGQRLSLHDHGSGGKVAAVTSHLHKVVPIRHSSGFLGVALGPPQLGPGQKHKVPGPSLASSERLGLDLFKPAFPVTLIHGKT